MASVVDLWRALDPGARLLGGSGSLGRAVRSVQRTRSAPPLLPDGIEGALLLADLAPFGTLDALLSTLADAEMAPAAVLLNGAAVGSRGDEGSAIAVLASDQPLNTLLERGTAYLADEQAWLQQLGIELRLACAEATLSEPEPATPAGLVGARLRRGVAVTADGELRTLHPREAGRALAARFAALHGRLLHARSGSASASSRRTREGLYVLERPVRPGANVWLFDDLPFAAVDEVAADAVAITLRALLRRPPQPTRAAPVAAPDRRPPTDGRSADPVTTTMVAVARHNGRIAPAARELGVHRNTVLYRLRRAAVERGLDPRRPEDALRILREWDGPA